MPFMGLGPLFYLLWGGLGRAHNLLFCRFGATGQYVGAIDVGFTAWCEPHTIPNYRFLGLVALGSRALALAFAVYGYGFAGYIYF